MKNSKKSLTLALLIGSLLGTGSVLANKIVDQINITSGRSITLQDQESMALSAARVLRHVADARIAIHKKDLATARVDITSAQTLMKIINQVRPITDITYNIHTKASKKHKAIDYHDTDKIPLEMIPIDMEQTFVTDLAPVKQAAMKAAHAHAHYLATKSRNKNTEAVAPVEDQDIFTEVAIPFTPTQELLNIAAKELNMNKGKNADKALELIEENTDITVIEANTPVEHARLNLLKATKQAYLSDTTKAKASLEKAEKWLKKAAKNADTKTRAKIKNLSNTMRSLKKKLTP